MHHDHDLFYLVLISVNSASASVVIINKSSRKRKERMVDQGNVSLEVIEAFAGLTGKSLRWVIAKVDGSDINLVQTGVRTSTLEELNAVLGDDPCFIVFDYEATRADGSTLCKTCFICYAPDSCTSMQRKFELQNFKACVEAKINFAKEMQINDKADLTE